MTICGAKQGFELTHLSFGYSSLKSLDILGVHSLTARILAAISFPCHLPRQVSPVAVTAIFWSKCGQLGGC